MDVASAALIAELRLADMRDLGDPTPGPEVHDRHGCILAQIENEMRRSGLLDHGRHLPTGLTVEDAHTMLLLARQDQFDLLAADLDIALRLSTMDDSEAEAFGRGVLHHNVTEDALIPEETHCTACYDLVPQNELIIADCEPQPHAYCRACLVSLFEAALRDDGLFPPACCRVQIPLDRVQQYLPATYPALFERRRIEMTTQRRTYCSNRDCGIFIAPNNIQADVASCPDCGVRTCVHCGLRAHNGLCAADPNTALLTQLAEELHWSICYNCNSRVEITGGCSHMLCRCGAQFCYVCGLRWHSCSHPLYTNYQDAMRARQNHVVPASNIARQRPPPVEPVRRPTAHQPPRPARPAIPATVAPAVPLTPQQQPQAQPTCLHPHLRRVERPNREIQCTDCTHNLQYILDCRGCHTQGCFRCLRNRWRFTPRSQPVIPDGFW